MSSSNSLPYITIEQWAEADIPPVTTTKDYLDTCADLTPESLGEPINRAELATRVDSTLEFVSDQLLKTRFTLATTRNRLVPSLHKLPEEILSMIFINIIFDPDDLHTPKSSSTEHKICLTYRRLYGLFGVCSMWKDIIKARGAFWSMIPLVANPSTKRRSSCELSIQRARGSKLHLAAVAESPETSEDLIEALTKFAPYFYTINLQIGDLQTALDAFDKVLQQGATGSLTELSIQYSNGGNASDWLPPDDDHLVRLDDPPSRQVSFARLIGSLAALRISAIHIHWDMVTFSTRLVELLIHNITLGFDHALYPFLQVLSSASGLRNLKIIRVDTFYDPDTIPGVEPEPSSPIVLPNLQLLHIEDLFFNTLQPLLLMIAPASYRLTLYLEDCSLRNNLNDTFHTPQELEDPEFAPVCLADLCRVLEKVPIDTLMLSGPILSGHERQWLTGTQLHEILASLPSLKTLKLHRWHFDSIMWDGLKQSQSNQKSFPALENLHLTAARISTDEGFYGMIASHPLQQVVLGANGTNPSDDEKWEPLEESSVIVGWLRENLPQLRIVSQSYIPLEFQLDKWQLW